jgi:hypothetical protein
LASYSRFCDLYREFEQRLPRVMRQHHVAGGLPILHQDPAAQGHSLRGHAERDLVAAAVPLPNGRAVTVGRADFDAVLVERRMRAWVIIRKQGSMPAR